MVIIPMSLVMSYRTVTILTPMSFWACLTSSGEKSSGLAITVTVSPPPLTPLETCIAQPLSVAAPVAAPAAERPRIGGGSGRRQHVGA
ncbi:hypothetical protein [Streptomyces purpurascens]